MGGFPTLQLWKFFVAKRGSQLDEGRRLRISDPDWRNAFLPNDEREQEGAARAVCDAPENPATVRVPGKESLNPEKVMSLPSPPLAKKIILCTI
jgi:hypothetical protein